MASNKDLARLGIDFVTKQLIDLEDNGKGNRLIQFGHEGTFCVNNDCPLCWECFRYDRTDNFQKYPYERL